MLFRVRSLFPAAAVTDRKNDRFLAKAIAPGGASRAYRGRWFS